LTSWLDNNFKTCKGSMLTMKKSIKHLFARLFTLLRRKKMQDPDDKEEPRDIDDMPNVRQGGVSVARPESGKEVAQKWGDVLKRVYRKRREHNNEEEE